MYLNNQGSRLDGRNTSIDHDQTTLSASCSGCAEVRSCWKQSNHEQTTLTAACLGCSEVRRGSKEANHEQTTISVTPDFLACGSETNAVFVYSKKVSSPLLTFQYTSARGAPRQSSEPKAFVSAVSWRNTSNVLLAANSQGLVNVLELC